METEIQCVGCHVPEHNWSVGLLAALVANRVTTAQLVKALCPVHESVFSDLYFELTNPKTSAELVLVAGRLERLRHE